MKQTEIKKPVVSATGKVNQIIGGNRGDDDSLKHYTKITRQKQKRFSVDKYLRDVLKACNTYANSDGDQLDAERFLNDWPSLPVKQKFKRGLQ